MDKLKKIYETMLDEAAKGTGKGFIITCNKCGEVSNITDNNKIKGKIKIPFYTDNKGFFTSIAFNCNKCKQYFEFDENQ